MTNQQTIKPVVWNKPNPTEHEKFLVELENNCPVCKSEMMIALMGDRMSDTFIESRVCRECNCLIRESYVRYH